MKKILLATVLVSGLPSIAYGQSDNGYCEAIALHDVPAIENASMLSEKGSKITYISQVAYDKSLMTMKFCIKGGMCYPLTGIFFNDTKSTENVPMIKFTNCKIGNKVISEDKDEKQYELLRIKHYQQAP